jgi:hypothetical protein
MVVKHTGDDVIMMKLLTKLRRGSLLFQEEVKPLAEECMAGGFELEVCWSM